MATLCFQTSFLDIFLQSTTQESLKKLHRQVFISSYLLNKITLQTFFGQNPTLKLLRIRQTQNDYFPLQNNFLISQVGDILGPSKLSKLSMYVSCQNNLIGLVIFKFFSLQRKLDSGISNRHQSCDLVNDITICHHFHV